MDIREHSYEEIRMAALDIIAGREQTSFDIIQFEDLALGVAQVVSVRDGYNVSIGNVPGGYQLSKAESEIFREVFWDFFRQGIITLVSCQSNNIG